MPAVIGGAAISALVAGFAFTAGALTIGFSIATFAGSLILGGLSYALTPKPPKPSGGNNAVPTQTVAVRQSDLTRIKIYGHTRVTRGFAHMQSTGLNGKLHIVMILCDGPLRAINEVWLNDYAIPNDWIDSAGNVTQGRYAGKLVIRKHLGTETQNADSLAVTNMSAWTAAHKLSGIAYLYMIMTSDQDVYPNGVPSVSAIVEGMEVYDPRTDSPEWTTNIALYSHDFLRNSEYGFGAFEDDIDLVNIAAQANICDEIVDTNAVDMEITGINTATNIITVDGDLLQYQFGDRVTITGGTELPGGITPGKNYYVIPYQIKDTPRLLLAETLSDAMNKISIDITSAGSGRMYVRKNGEPRYHGGGVVETDQPLSQTLNNLVTCMAGRAVNVGGFWTLLAGAWRTPSTSFGIGDIRGSGIGFKNNLSMSESYNLIKGLFISSVNSYQPSDYPSARYQTFIDQDNGIESPKELNLPFCNRNTTAQRIAKIELFRGRQDIVFNADFSTFALNVQPGDNVMLDIDRLGWEGKYFEVTEFSFDLAAGNIITRMTLRETAQEIFDWSSGEAIDYDPAPNTSLPNPFLVLAVSGLSYSSRQTLTTGDEIVFTLVLNWSMHPDAFVNQFGDFEIQYKLSTETDWRPSFFVDGSLTTTDVVQASINTKYDVRIRARNNLGVRSSWNTIYEATVGYSGGVTETRDYEFVNDPIGTYLDYGSVADAVTDSEDWGFVE